MTSEKSEVSENVDSLHAIRPLFVMRTIHSNVSGSLCRAALQPLLNLVLFTKIGQLFWVYERKIARYGATVADGRAHP